MVVLVGGKWRPGIGFCVDVLDGLYGGMLVDVALTVAGDEWKMRFFLTQARSWLCDADVCLACRQLQAQLQSNIHWLPLSACACESSKETRSQLQAEPRPHFLRQALTFTYTARAPAEKLKISTLRFITFRSSNSSLKKSQSELTHRHLRVVNHRQLWEKVPGHPTLMVGTRKRAATEAHTAAYPHPPSLHPSLPTLPTVRTPARKLYCSDWRGLGTGRVRLTACLLLRR